MGGVRRRAERVLALGVRLIVFEGADATGTSSHADGVAAALVERGYLALPFHHRPAPPRARPWLRALHYARERAAFVEGLGDVVVLADRWTLSNRVMALGSPPGRVRDVLVELSRIEEGELPKPCIESLLDADDEVLDARLVSRGERVRAEDREIRRLYREQPSLLRVDTARPVEEVRAELLDLVEGVLRA